jgi:hypothetical protein
MEVYIDVLDSKLGNGPDNFTFHLGKFQSIHIQIPTIHIKWVPKQIPLPRVPSKSYSNSLWLIQKGHKSHIPFQAALDYQIACKNTNLEIQRFHTRQTYVGHE